MTSSINFGDYFLLILDFRFIPAIFLWEDSILILLNRKMPLLLLFSLIKLLSLISVKVYPNASIAKLEILSSNKEKITIYLWTHKESSSKYVGSAFDLVKRLNSYYYTSGLKQINSYIYRAFLHHTYCAFSLSILEYINIFNLSKDTARLLILSREQYYINLI